MQNIKTMVSLPGWAQAFENGGGNANGVRDVQSAYAKVPLVFRAARIRANALQKVPLHFRRVGAEAEAEYPFDLSLQELVWKTEIALCLSGGATWLKNKTQLPTLGFDIAQGLAWLNPFTVNVKWEGNQRVFWQSIDGTRYPAQGFWTDDDVVFIREFSPSDDIGFGVSPASVALGSSQLAFYVSRVASVFFENGAMPVTMATIAGLSSNPEDPANKRIGEFLRRAMTGMGRFARILAVGNDVKMQTTQSPLKDMVIPELKADARKDVAMAFEIPVTLLDEDANYATAAEHKRGFYDETIIPRAGMIESELNRQWLNPLGYEVEFAPEEMDLYQDDEASRATSLAQLVNAIDVNPEVARFAMAVLGYDLSDEQSAELDAMITAKQQAASSRQQVVPPQSLRENQQQQQDANAQDQNAAQKALERGQFKRFAEKHPDQVDSFTFHHLDADEQAAIKGAQPRELKIKWSCGVVPGHEHETESDARKCLGAQPSDEGAPFRDEVHREYLRALRARVDRSSA